MSRKGKPAQQLQQQQQANQQSSSQSSGMVLPAGQRIKPENITLSSLVWRVDPATIFGKSMKLLGEGSSGTVFLAKHQETGKLVALKRISNQQQEMINIAKIEIFNMSQLSHPCIVEYLGAYMWDQYIYISLEYMEGGSLMEVVTGDNPMTESQVAYVCRNVLEALHAMHMKGFIHRDVKSDNVLLDGQGRVKIADFGFGAQLTMESQKRQSVVGSPYWMAPELIKAENYDMKVDVWSLGILCMEMLDGEPPYMDVPPVRALFLIVTNGTPPIEEPERLSPELRDFVGLCLTINPTLRPTAAELLKHKFLEKANKVKDLSKLMARK